MKNRLVINGQPASFSWQYESVKSNRRHLNTLGLLMRRRLASAL
jgi:hypothetical protein